MPALNVEFTEDELIRLRLRAVKRGVALKRMVHDSVLAEDDRATHRERLAAIVNEAAVISAPMLKGLAER